MKSTDQVNVTAAHRKIELITAEELQRLEQIVKVALEVQFLQKSIGKYDAMHEERRARLLTDLQVHETELRRLLTDLRVHEMEWLKLISAERVS